MSVPVGLSPQVSLKSKEDLSPLSCLGLSQLEEAGSLEALISVALKSLHLGPRVSLTGSTHLLRIPCPSLCSLVCMFAFLCHHFPRRN